MTREIFPASLRTITASVFTFTLRMLTMVVETMRRRKRRRKMVKHVMKKVMVVMMVVMMKVRVVIWGPSCLAHD